MKNLFFSLLLISSVTANVAAISWNDITNFNYSQYTQQLTAAVQTYDYGQLLENGKSFVQDNARTLTVGFAAVCGATALYQLFKPRTEVINSTENNCIVTRTASISFNGKLRYVVVKRKNITTRQVTTITLAGEGAKEEYAQMVEMRARQLEILSGFRAISIDGKPSHGIANIDGQEVITTLAVVQEVHDVYEE